MKTALQEISEQDEDFESLDARALNKALQRVKPDTTKSKGTSKIETYSNKD